MKRDKIKKDDVSVNFRVEKPLKTKMLSAAKEKNMTLSKYLREVLEGLYDEAMPKPREFPSETERFLFSKEFLQFVFWVYSKKQDKERGEHDDIDGHIKLIKRAGGILPDAIVKELDKVLVDLFRIKTASGFDKKYYQFPDSYNDDRKLDYKKLEEFFTGQDFMKYLDKKRGCILI